MSEHENEQRETLEPGRIGNVGLLDLRSAKTPEDLAYIKQITNVGTILIPEHLTGVLARVPMKNVGGVVGLPEGEKITMQTGQVRMGGEGFARGDAETILFIVGQLFVASPVASVGYKEVWVHGQVFAPRGSEDTLGAKLGRVQGQVLYLPGEARIITGSELIDAEYLELLPRPCAIVAMGELRFAEDVTKDLLKSKILEIVLMGTMAAPQSLLPLLRVLTPERMGEIFTLEERQRREEERQRRQEKKNDGNESNG